MAKSFTTVQRDGCYVFFLFLNQGEIEKLKHSLATLGSETEKDKSSVQKVMVENERLRKEVKKVN